MFSTFPSGRPGAGLFLLRGVLAITVFAQGAAYLSNWQHLTFVTEAVAVLLIVVSGLLLVGYLTPLASILAGLSNLGSAFSSLLQPAPSPLAAKAAIALATVIAAALVCLGPGAFSLDARLFGRREIVIPNSHPPSDL
jgi:uncharacterized membrane protein YphA (DoxX/SURF4 family)